jgi:Ca2+-transporting ATPase
MADEWHVREWGEVAGALKTDVERGLTLAEVDQRRAEHGLNELVDRGVKNPWRILWEQFTATMVVILIVAALASALLGKVTESLSIFIIVFLFGILGFVQEYRAEKAMAALRQMAAPVVRVKREWKLKEVSARELVPVTWFPQMVAWWKRRTCVRWNRCLRVNRRPWRKTHAPVNARMCRWVTGSICFTWAP